MKKNLPLFLTSLSLAFAHPLSAEEVNDEELAPQQELLLDTSDIDAPSPNRDPSKKHKVMKTIGIVVGFAASVTVGLLLSSHNTGKRAPSSP